MAGQDQVGFRGPVVANRHSLSGIIGNARAAALSCNAVIAAVIQEGLLEGVLAPEGLTVTDVIVHLTGVDVPVPVGTTQARAVDRRVPVEATWHRRIGSKGSHQLPEVGRPCIHSAGRNHVVVESTATRASTGISGSRVKYHALTQLSRTAAGSTNHDGGCMCGI